MPGLGYEFLAELKRLADPADLPALLDACIGRRIFIPNGENVRAGQSSWISRAIGPEKARILIEAFASKSWIFGDIDVPMDSKGYHAALKRRVDNLFTEAQAAGKSNGETAAICGITERAVRRRKQTLRERLARDRRLKMSVAMAAKSSQ